MGKSVVLGIVTMVVSFSMYESYIDCYNDVEVTREGILGKNVTFRCYTSWVCDEVRWDFLRAGNTGELSGEQFQVGYNTSYLSIFGIGFHHDGRYRCWCYANSSVESVCSVTLKTICQATVRLNGRTIVYNNSSPYSHVVDITEGETIRIAYPEGAALTNNCALQASDELTTYTFEVLQEHNSCSIQCLLSSGDKHSCRVNFTLNVTRLETSTSHSTTSTTVSTVSFHLSVNQSTSSIISEDRSMSGSFPVVLLVGTGISIVVFVGILSIICFFIYFSKSKSSSRPFLSKTQAPNNESPDTNIPIGPTYATVNKSSSGCTKDDDHSERGIPYTDDAYAEAVTYESSTHQSNNVKTEMCITKDYYSVVDTLNTKLESTDNGSKSESALYTEVDKGVKQTGEKVSTFSPGNCGCNPSVSDVESYDVLEQPESSEYDAGGVISTSPALYAVVDKERKKE